MALTTNPALDAHVQQTTDKIGAIANFMVDNNETAVFAVLKANGYNFNTHGEAAAILKSIILSRTEKSLNELAQLAKIPYINSNPNGTGGLRGSATGDSITGIGDDLLCTVGTLYGIPLGCSKTPTAEEIAAQQKAAEEAAKAKQKQTIIIVAVVAVVVVIIAVIYFKNKKKN